MAALRRSNTGDLTAACPIADLTLTGADLESNRRKSDSVPPVERQRISVDSVPEVVGIRSQR
jgi:hypothetical protein